MSLRTLMILGLVCLAASCTPRRQPPPPPPPNAGVDIVPRAILAGEKMTPSDQMTDTSQPDLVDTISTSELPHYHIIDVLRSAGLMRQMQEVGPYTILAPTDDAFNKMPPGWLDQLLKPENHKKLVELAKFHILKGRIGLRDLQETNGVVTTLQGSTVTIRGIDSKVIVNDTNIIRTDTGASNGIIQWIDGVLIPPGE